MPPLFHHSQCTYEPGDVIHRTGRRDRILELPLDSRIRIREMRFEEVRSREFPEAVSRLDCNWVYEELAPARRGMRDGNLDRWPSLYEVRLVDDGVRCHRGALDILNTEWTLAFGDQGARDELIRTYWRGLGVGSGGLELLIDGDLEVVALLMPSQTLPEVDVEVLFPAETEDN